MTVPQTPPDITFKQLAELGLWIWMDLSYSNTKHGTDKCLVLSLTDAGNLSVDGSIMEEHFRRRLEHLVARYQ